MRRFKKRQWEDNTWRLVFLGWLFSFLILVFLFRTFSYQVWHAAPWKDMAQQQYQCWMKLIARRGLIYDRHKNILAMDLPSFSLAADPSKIRNFVSMAETLRVALGGKADMYLQILNENRSREFVWIEKDIDEPMKNRLFSRKIDGLIPVQGRKRVHPFDDLAIPVIGLTDGLHEGVAGIELACNEQLQGENGWAIYQKNATNQQYASLDYPVEAPENGRHIILTLDHVAQNILEEEITAGVSRYRARGGFGILMDPFTGEILAIANEAGSRLKKELSQFDADVLNQAVQKDFEPGSIFKIITAAAALEEGVFRPNSLIHCENGSYEIGGHTINDHNKAYGMLSFTQVMEQSSNIGMAKVAHKLGRRALYKYIQNFGFGTRSGISLPGEVAGIVRPYYQWSDFSLASISYGQEISVTGIQLVAMISAIANGGELVKPWIVKATLDENGREIQDGRGQVLRRVISENTASEMRSILESVVVNGSGSAAAVEGVRVAGKTGTAQKSMPGYTGYVPGANISSFIGFWPVETPMYAMVVVLDEPRINYWGSLSAAPVFARIVERISGLPVTPRDDSLPDNPRTRNTLFRFTSLETDHESVSGENENRPQMPASPYHVPDLRGMSLREALSKLAERKVQARSVGHGIVIYQTPGPGQKVSGDMICTLICRDRAGTGTQP